MIKSEFITRVKETHQEFESVLASLNEEQMLRPHTCGDWSVKDMVAHVTWYEREMVGVLEGRALVGSELWNLPLEDRNAVIYVNNKNCSLQDILSEAGRVHRQLLELLQDLSQQEMLEAGCFREMPPDWIPWQVIASNTFEHYPVHVADIRKAFFEETGLPTRSIRSPKDS
jgi:hypothetical protein